MVNSQNIFSDIGFGGFLNKAPNRQLHRGSRRSTTARKQAKNLRRGIAFLAREERIRKEEQERKRTAHFEKEFSRAKNINRKEREAETKVQIARNKLLNKQIKERQAQSLSKRYFDFVRKSPKKKTGINKKGINKKGINQKGIPRPTGKGFTRSRIDPNSVFGFGYH